MAGRDKAAEQLKEFKKTQVVSETRRSRPRGGHADQLVRRLRYLTQIIVTIFQISDSTFYMIYMHSNVNSMRILGFFISSDCNLFCFNKINNTLSLFICSSSVFAFTRCADMFSRYHNHLISEGRCVDHRNRCPCGSEDSHNDGGSTGAGPSPGLRLHWWDGTLQPWKNPREGGPCQRSRSLIFSISATPLMLLCYGR